MIEQFYNFQSTAIGVLQLLVIMAIGYWMSWRKIIDTAGSYQLGNILLLVCLPLLIFTTTVASFDPVAMPQWWFLPFACIIMTVGGMALAWGIARFLPTRTALRESMLSVGFQNCGYLPMALVAFVCSGEACSTILVYVFLFMIGFNAIVWSVSVSMLQGKFDRSFVRNFFLNGLTISTLLAIISVFLFGRGWLPAMVNTPLKQIGDLTFPLALILLGANLEQHRGYHLTVPSESIACLVAKLVVLPLITLVVLMPLSIGIMYKFIIFLQATMPSAVTMIAVGEYTRANNKFFSGVIFYSHLLSVVTVPLWLVVFKAFVH